MAWRIEENVVRGEIDNRVRGRVTARLWFCGREDSPMNILLQGDTEPDLHGRLLTFTNPGAKPGFPEGLRMEQRGQAGHITASRKVKIPDVPLDRLHEYFKAGKPYPFHWANVLYFEWYSQTNGRVLIEAPYELVLSPEAPTWRLTPEEVAEREARLAAAEAESDPITIVRNPDFADDDDADDDFGDSDGDDDDFENWIPPTEEEADRDQERSDILTDRIMARMEREGPDADYEKILDEEITRMRKERGEPEPTPEQLADNQRRMDELNAGAAEALQEMEAENWKDDEDDERPHPLVERVRNFSYQIYRDIETRGWMPGEDAHHEHPVLQLRGSITCIGPKLGGTMPSADDWPPPLFFTAHAIVRLKKALGFVEDALLAAESCAEQNLTDPAWLAEVVRETKAIGAEIEAIIAEQRARLKDGRE